MEAAAAASPAPPSEMPAADIGPAQPAVAEAVADTQALSAETGPVEAPVATAQAVAETPAEAIEQVAEAVDISAEDADGGRTRRCLI